MNQDMSEIRRPMRNIDDERLRQRLSTIDSPPRPSTHSIKKKSIIIWLIIVIVIIIIGIVIIFRVFSQNKNSPDWQAVFLSDGQVYFGKVVSESAKDVILRNIYYLKEPEVLRQGSEIGQQGGDFVLIKLGNEIHGPYDEMRINRQHVLYIEDLKDDSKVVKAIKDYIIKIGGQ